MVCSGPLRACLKDRGAVVLLILLLILFLFLAFWRVLEEEDEDGEEEEEEEEEEKETEAQPNFSTLWAALPGQGPDQVGAGSCWVAYFATVVRCMSQ
jgi:hypothetical protein